MSQPKNLTEGNILSSLMGFALPVLAALFLQTMYGAVDMMIVGRFSQASEVSAVSTGSWIMQTITTAIVGLSMGTTILLGRRIGEKQPEEAGRVAGRGHLVICMDWDCGHCGNAVLAVPAAGWMRAPIATVFAQVVSVVLSFAIIRKQELPFVFDRKSIRWNRPLVRHIVKLGFPIAFQDVLVSISFLVISAIVNTLGVIPSAGVGVAEKLAGFVLLVPSAYSQAMSAFVAQNIGAKRPDRARKALAYGILTSLGARCVPGLVHHFSTETYCPVFSPGTGKWSWRQLIT